MSRAHWFTRARVAFRVWRLRRALRIAEAGVAWQTKRFMAFQCGDGAYTEADDAKAKEFCERRYATLAELRALGAGP